MPDGVVDALFKRMFAFYGNTWLDRWVGGDVAHVKAVWASELSDCTPQMIGEALKSLSGTFPPSLPEFRALCKAFRPQRVTASLVALQDKRPPPPEALKRIHEILGKTGNS